MGRNAVRKMQQGGEPAQAATPTQGLETPMMKGGAAGVPGVKLQAIPPGMVTDRRTPEVTTSKKYEVVGGPNPVPGGYMVHYPNQGKMRLSHGKIVDESNCDIAHLRKQGVRLQEIIPPAPPEPVVDEEVRVPNEDEGEETDGED